MTRLISLTPKAKNAELKGQAETVVSMLKKLGADKKPVEFATLKKNCRSIKEPARLRAHVRALTTDKIVTVKREKEEKAA